MKRVIKSLYIRQRAKTLIMAGENNFSQAVCGCANVSRFNPNLCFIVERKAMFGNPIIQRIDRPKEIIIYEHLNGVIIKDGVIYELVKR